MKKMFRMIRMIKRMAALMLAMAMLLAAMPVTDAEAKKLGKIQMSKGWSSDMSNNSDLFNDGKVDYPKRGYTWMDMKTQLYCKPKDVFTLVGDSKEFDRLTRGTQKTYGKILWHTSNPDVATVNKNGKVTVKSEGYAIISAGIMVKGTNIYGEAYDHEQIVYYHHIFSGPVLQLSKTNVKAVAKNANTIFSNGRVPVVRVKGSAEETEELLAAFVKEVNKKYGRNWNGKYSSEIGNFTYWW